MSEARGRAKAVQGLASARPGPRPLRARLLVGVYLLAPFFSIAPAGAGPVDEPVPEPSLAPETNPSPEAEVPADIIESAETEEAEDPFADILGDSPAVVEEAPDELIDSDAEIREGESEAVLLEGAASEPERSWGLRLRMSSQNGYWLGAEQNRSSNLRQRAELEFRKRAGRVKFETKLWGEFNPTLGGAAWGDETREVYGTWARINELFATLERETFEFAAGRQVLGWGDGQVLSPIGRLDPQDRRYLGSQRVDGPALGTWSTRVSRYWKEHRFDMVIRHEEQGDSWPAPQGPYGQWGAWGATANRRVSDGDAGLGPLADATKLRSALPPIFDGGQHYFARWFYQGADSDLAGYLAWTSPREGVLVLPALGDTLRLDYPQRLHVGTSGSSTQGPFVLRWEALYGQGVASTSAERQGDDLVLATQNVNTWELMAGFTYIWGLGVEVSTASLGPRRIPGVLSARNVSSLALYATQRLLRGKLQVDARGVAHNKHQGWLASLEVLALPRDSWRLGGGFRVIEPAGGLGTLSGLGGRDEVYFKAEWDLQL